MNMMSQRGEDFLKGWEKLRLIAYPDSRGRWTIGWGHTGPEVCAGVTWTREQADAAFERDSQWAVEAVNNLVKVPLSQPQFDALVSLVYNIGEQAFSFSTLLRMVNQQDFAGARGQFKRWNKEHRDGKVVASAGLTNRRNAEAMMFAENA